MLSSPPLLYLLLEQVDRSWEPCSQKGNGEWDSPANAEVAGLQQESKCRGPGWISGISTPTWASKPAGAQGGQRPSPREGGAGTMSWAGIWETQGGPASARSLNYHIRLPWPPHLVSNKTVTPESWCINKLMWFFSCSAKFFCSWKITFFSLHYFFSCSPSFFVLFLRKIESHWYLLFLFFGLLTRAFWG